jgi:hypothetical protein
MKPNESNSWLVDVSNFRWIGLWPLVAGAGFLVLLEFRHLQHPANAFFASWYDEFCVVMFLFGAAGLAQLVWMRPERQSRLLQFSLSQMFWLMTLVTLILSANGFAKRRGPLHFAFQTHRAEFDRLADLYDPSIQRTVPLPLPVDVGPYEFVEIRTVQDCVVLYLTTPQSYQGPYAFARLPGCRSDAEVRRKIGYHSLQRLEDDWFVIFDYYRFAKTGPS